MYASRMCILSASGKCIFSTNGVFRIMLRRELARKQAKYGKLFLTSCLLKRRGLLPARPKPASALSTRRPSSHAKKNKLPYAKNGVFSAANPRKYATVFKKDWQLQTMIDSCIDHLNYNSDKLTDYASQISLNFKNNTRHFNLTALLYFFQLCNWVM